MGGAVSAFFRLDGVPNHATGASQRRGGGPKVFVEGARAVELPIPRPGEGCVESGEAVLSLPPMRKPRSRRFRRLPFGFVPGYCPITLDANDPDTVNCAFRQRLLRRVPNYDPVVLALFQTFVRDWVREKIPVARQISFEEWKTSLSFNEARLQELQEAYDALRGGPPTRRQCEHIDSFVKTESYPELKHARMINSRSDAFKVFSGPRFKAIEEVLYALPQFIKHTPVPERPARVRALRRLGYKVFATDFTAYESHFIPEVMSVCECALYLHCLQWDEHRFLLCRTLCGPNRMRTRSGIRAVVKGRRMSGDMCTSLGNGFTNLMLALFIAHMKGGNLDGLVEGDDGLFVTDIELTPEDYEILGFTIKIERVLDPCEASFCGMIFSESGEIVRNPRKFLQTFGWTSSFVNAGNKIMLELLRAKSLSCVYETPQCPIVGAIARYTLKMTTGSAARFVTDGYHIVPRDTMKVPEFNPSTDTRLLFERQFGISVDSQKLAEEAAMCGDFGRIAELLPPSAHVAWFEARYTVTD